MSFQWSTGVQGNSTPISGATANSVTVSPTSTTSYFVIATNSCGSATSVPVTVTVAGTACPPPTLAQPADQTIIVGLPTTITVNASGSNLSFQWFRGPKDNQSNPVGTNSATLNVEPLTQTTQFWVRVTSNCGSSSASASSETITITTQVGRRRASRR